MHHLFEIHSYAYTYFADERIPTPALIEGGFQPLESINQGNRQGEPID